MNNSRPDPLLHVARLKTNITPLTNVLEKLAQLRGVSFEWNDAAAPLAGHTPGQRDIGVIAQEVEAVFPELVTTWGKEEYKAVSYDKLTGVLLAAAKELKAQADVQQAKTDAQQQYIMSLEARLVALEQASKGDNAPGQKRGRAEKGTDLFFCIRHSDFEDVLEYLKTRDRSMMHHMAPASPALRGPVRSSQ